MLNNCHKTIFLTLVLVFQTINLYILFNRPWKYESTAKKYFVTFLIKTAVNYDNRRNLIRETWGSLDSISDYRLEIKKK